MKIYTCKDHEGYWPVPTASVIVAENEQQAFLLLKEELKRQGIEDDRFTLVELETTSPKAVVLSNGNY